MYGNSSHNLRPLVLVVAVLVISRAHGRHCFAQDNVNQTIKAPAVELLTLSGSKPNPSTKGEGITSIKTSDLFKRGVTHVKPFDGSFKIELPVGYKAVNNLGYMIDTEAVYSGPTDIAFRIRAAATKE